MTFSKYPLGPDALTVEALGTRIVLTTFIGKSTTILVEPAWRRFEAVVGRMDSPIWVSDARHLTGFEPRTLTLGPRWFSLFRGRGGSECLVVSRWNVAIMAASTMALGLGVRIRCFDRLEDAKAAALAMLQGEARTG